MVWKISGWSRNDNDVYVAKKISAFFYAFAAKTFYALRRKVFSRKSLHPESFDFLGLWQWQISIDTGCFFDWYPPKKYGKPRLGESTLT